MNKSPRVSGHIRHLMNSKWWLLPSEISPDMSFFISFYLRTQQALRAWEVSCHHSPSLLGSRVYEESLLSLLNFYFCVFNFCFRSYIFWWRKLESHAKIYSYNLTRLWNGQEGHRGSSCRRVWMPGRCNSVTERWGDFYLCNTLIFLKPPTKMPRVKEEESLFQRSTFLQHPCFKELMWAFCLCLSFWQLPDMQMKNIHWGSWSQTWTQTWKSTSEKSNVFLHVQQL